jgi:hypothetical protein
MASWFSFLSPEEKEIAEAKKQCTELMTAAEKAVKIRKQSDATQQAPPIGAQTTVGGRRNRKTSKKTKTKSRTRKSMFNITLPKLSLWRTK